MPCQRTRWQYTDNFIEIHGICCDEEKPSRVFYRTDSRCRVVIPRSGIMVSQSYSVQSRADQSSDEQKVERELFVSIVLYINGSVSAAQAEKNPIDSRCTGGR